MDHTRRRHLAFIGAALSAPALSRAAYAQAWPTRSIRVIMPFSAGSTGDIVARIVCDPLSQLIGQPVVVENRVGAGGTIGAGMVARAEPDGYTLLVNSSAHAAAPAIYANVPYDTARDFAAVAALGSSPNVTVIAPDKGIKTLQELVAAARVKPGGLSFATAGVGSATHFSTERFRLSAGFAALHVPFRGMPEALTEVMTGRVDFSCSSISAALPFIQDGKLLALAVTTPQRASALPNVPTSLELGYANSDYTFWTGMFAPAKTPRDLIEKLHAEVQRAIAMPGVKEKLAIQGVDPMPVGATAFDAQVKAEVESNIALAKAAGIKAN